MTDTHEKTAGALQQALDELVALECSVVDDQQQTQRAHQRFNVSLKAVLIALSFLALLNIHYLHVLTQEFRVMLNDMVAMYEHFGRVAERMNDMTVSVTSMEQDVKMMPVITLQMEAMNTDIGSMRDNMTGMSTDVLSMEQRIGTINNDVLEMSQRFRNVNVNVGNMGYNVNQMSDVVP